jgi:hypothetical protein
MIGRLKNAIRAIAWNFLFIFLKLNRFSKLLFECAGSAVTECQPWVEGNYWYSFRYIITMN